MGLLGKIFGVGKESTVASVLERYCHYRSSGRPRDYGSADLIYPAGLNSAFQVIQDRCGFSNPRLLQDAKAQFIGRILWDAEINKPFSGKAPFFTTELNLIKALVMSIWSIENSRVTNSEENEIQSLISSKASVETLRRLSIFLEDTIDVCSIGQELRRFDEDEVRIMFFSRAPLKRWIEMFSDIVMPGLNSDHLGNYSDKARTGYVYIAYLFVLEECAGRARSAKFRAANQTKMTPVFQLIKHHFSLQLLNLFDSRFLNYIERDLGDQVSREQFYTSIFPKFHESDDRVHSDLVKKFPKDSDQIGTLNIQIADEYIKYCLDPIVHTPQHDQLVIELSKQIAKLRLEVFKFFSLIHGQCMKEAVVASSSQR